MKDHINKSRLLDFYFSEGSKRSIQKIRDHVHSCSECRDYLETLGSANSMLKTWEDQKPAPDTFQRIMAQIPRVHPKPVVRKQVLSLWPIVEIATSLLVILVGLFALQNILHKLPLWEVLEQNWIIQSLGSFGVTIVLFFMFGTFVTFCLAPILLLEARRVRSVRQWI